MPRTRLFKDISKLSFDYVPSRLVHRDEHLGRLDMLFQPVLSATGSQTVFFHGSVGTGKTALSKRFCLDLGKKASKAGRVLDFVMVNCRQRATEASVMLRIVNHFQPDFPDRGFSIPEMLTALRKDLEKRGSHLVIVLDEADVLLKKSGSDLIYNFTRFDEEGMGDGKRMVSLILISQKDVLSMLDAATLSTFRRGNILRFDKYSRKELFDIVEVRTDLAFYPDGVSLDSLELIADIASEWGDARYAIELLYTAGMLADEKHAEAVSPEHVRAAKAETNSTVTESGLSELDLHKKILLLAISRTLRRSAYAKTGDVEKAYAVVCEEYVETPRGHTQFWKYLKDLDARGLISAKRSSKGHVGSTSHISLQDIPADALEEKLLELIGK